MFLPEKLSPSVAFSVRHRGGKFNVSQNQPLSLDQVLLNLGNAYTPRNGEFVTPVSGLYLISFRAWSDVQKAFYVHLNVNGQFISEVSNFMFSQLLFLEE